MSSQNHWASCGKCQTMFYAGFDGHGVCPADQGEHDPAVSFDYSLPFDIGGDGHAQPGWRSCPKCQCMFFDGVAFKGVCPQDGLGHDSGGSFAYVVKHDLPAVGQPEWRSCSKCLSLYYGPFAGRCKAGGTHDWHPSGSFSYSVDFGAGLFIQLNGPGFIFHGGGYPPNSRIHIEYNYKTKFSPSENTQGSLDPTTGAQGQFSIFTTDIPTNRAYFIDAKASDHAAGTVLAVAPRLIRADKAHEGGEPGF